MFTAKPGREHEFEELLNNPESGRMFAQLLGATRNILFLREGRMIRVLEFPERGIPISMADLAERDPDVKAFLRKIGPLIEDGFDVDVPGSIVTFSRRNMFNLVYDVRVVRSERCV